MNPYLIGPELILGIAGIVIILLDLVVERKGALPAVGITGIVIAGLFTGTMVGFQDMAFSGMLVVDSLGIFFKFVFLGVAALVVLSSAEQVKRFRRTQGEYYALVLFATAGMMLMAGTKELISVYIALELMSIAVYVLAAFLRGGKPSEAGLKFMLLGAFSSAILLYGMTLVFGLTGTTDLATIGASIAAVQATSQWALAMATALLVVGLGLKIAASRLQLGAVEAYEGARTPVTGLLSAGGAVAGFAVVLRMFDTVNGGLVDWQMTIAVLSVVVMSIGNVLALGQSNMRRLLAYSGVAQMGFLFIGVATAPYAFDAAARGIVFFLLGFALTSLGSFIAVVAISERTGGHDIAGYSGMARRSPGLALALALCLAASTGLPPAIGFAGKFYLFSSAIEAGWIWLVVVGLVNSVVPAYYCGKVIKAMYLGAAPSEERVRASGSVLAAVSLSAAGVVVASVSPNMLFQWLETAARSFLG